MTTESSLDLELKVGARNANKVIDNNLKKNKDILFHSTIMYDLQQFAIQMFSFQMRLISFIIFDKYLSTFFDGYGHWIVMLQIFFSASSRGINKWKRSEKLT